MGIKLQRNNSDDARGEGSNKTSVVCLAYLSTGKQRFLTKSMFHLIFPGANQAYTSMDPYASLTWGFQSLPFQEFQKEIIFFIFFLNKQIVVGRSHQLFCQKTSRTQSRTLYTKHLLVQTPTA